MDTVQGVILGLKGQGGRFKLGLGESAGRGVQVEPEEDARAEVLQHLWQTGVAESGPLVIEPGEINFFGELLCRKPRRLAPEAAEFAMAASGGVEKPLDKRRFDPVWANYGKQGAGLDIGLWIQSTLGRVQPPFCKPGRNRQAKPSRGRSPQRAAESVAESIKANAVIRLADGHKIQAGALRQPHVPVVVRNAGKNMFRRQQPPCS